MQHTVDIESLQPAIQELERAIQWVAHPTDLAAGHRVVPVIQTRGKRRACAWFAPNRWSTKEGDLCHEITFTAEDLARDVEPIVATAAHEVAHLLAYSQGVSDVSGNQYHNSEFKKRAEALGLRCPLGRVPGRGWAYTEATEELGQRIRDELQPDYQAFQLFRLAFQNRPKSPVKMAKWRCACTTVRCATALDALCQLCGEPFQKSVKSAIGEMDKRKAKGRIGGKSE